MQTIDIITIIGQIITFLGVVFIVYNYFRNPQIKADKIDALLEQKIKLTNESNERRFTEINSSVKNAFELAFNHSNSVEVKVDSLTNSVNNMNLQMSNEITKLSTIIQERLPQK